ncbi:uncharacterized protein [Panulirus ornatus]|uniref:uncharacterized protein n=1 Tax=Panulirus ornatus TaxID=150431 RepID=UPI003A8B8233
MMLQRLKDVSRIFFFSGWRSSTVCRSFHDEPHGIVVSQEVKEALSSHQPVVALESTIITHGMPYPQNLETAIKVEDIIRKEGAVPATIAILKGCVHAGLSREELHTLAAKKEPCMKTSRRDFPYVMAKGINGGTTVSGTMMIADKIKIPIFVTGGIGGVHRGAESTLDISADLTELGRTPVTVVSAGVKSILDIGRTLEYLETQGVCVSVLGPTPQFPDFFTRDSGYTAPYHVGSPELAALMMQKRAELGTNSGILIAVPIPLEHEAEGLQIKDAIGKSKQLKKQRKAVRGRDVTPFILQRVSEITGGQSLNSNIALIENNAKTGAQIAVEYSKLTISSSSFIPRESLTGEKSSGSEVHGRPVVIGGSIVDLIATVMEPEIKFSGMTHRGSVRQSYGGVGRNMADALARLGCRPLLVSAVGRDAHAHGLTAHNPLLDQRGLAMVAHISTASYCVVLDHLGEALFGVGDMSVHDHVTPQHVEFIEKGGDCVDYLVRIFSVFMVHGEVPEEWRNGCMVPLYKGKGDKVWYEPTDIQKAVKPWLGGRGDKVAFASPNLNELLAICSHLGLERLLKLSTDIFPLCVCSFGAAGAPRKGELRIDPERTENLHELLKQILTTATPLLQTMQALLVTLGQHGFMVLRLASHDGIDNPLLPVGTSADTDATTLKCESVVGLHFPGPVNPQIVSVSGAGDCLAAGFIAGMLNGKSVSKCSGLGLSAATLSLATSPAVPHTLTPQAVPWDHHEAFTIVA